MLTPALVLALALVPPQEAAAPERYIRLTENENEGELHLEVAVRRFAREGSPDVHLAAAIHIGQRSFYEALQKRLDGLDLVLFESVKPPGTGDPAHDVGPVDEDTRAAVTRGRIRFLAMAMHAYRERNGEFPGTLAELAAGLPADQAILAEQSMDDAWGRKLALVAASKRERRAFDIQSLGADGRLGGSGANADLLFTDQDALTDAELGESDGFQQTLASALDLEFQLDVMDHTGANWRNSDLAMDQVEARLARAGLGGESVFGVLDGGDWVTDAFGFVLDLLTRFSYTNAAIKLLGIEVLSRADEMLAQAPPEMQGLLRVLLDDRNSVVLDDLRAVLENEDGLRSIGIIYGAAHMDDLERRLTGELGYSVAGETWTPAVSIDLDELGISRLRVDAMRGIVKDALEGGGLGSGW